jgi:hypothetical protein
LQTYRWVEPPTKGIEKETGCGQKRTVARETHFTSIDVESATNYIVNRPRDGPARLLARPTMPFLMPFAVCSPAVFVVAYANAVPSVRLLERVRGPTYLRLPHATAPTELHLVIESSATLSKLGRTRCEPELKVRRDACVIERNGWPEQLEMTPRGIYRTVVSGTCENGTFPTAGASHAAAQIIAGIAPLASTFEVKR